MSTRAHDYSVESTLSLFYVSMPHPQLETVLQAVYTKTLPDEAEFYVRLTFSGVKLSKTQPLQSRNWRETFTLQVSALQSAPISSLMPSAHRTAQLSSVLSFLLKRKRAFFPDHLGFVDINIGELMDRCENETSESAVYVVLWLHFTLL